jgi:Cd2+/Zn2+-exporting ATPase
VISTPVTIVSALAGLARLGVLVKGGAFLDVLARLRTLAFDKTGTLTRGEPAVMQTHTPNCPADGQRCANCDEMLALATTVERRTAHPLARAILAEAETRAVGHQYPAAEAVQVLNGLGVQGQAGAAAVTVGSHTLFHTTNGYCEPLHAQIAAAEAQGQTVVLVSQAERLLGFVGLADVPRPDAQVALAALKSLDPTLRTVMLTGDNPTAAQQVAQQVGGIDEVRAGLLPEDKAAAVQALQAQYGPLAMVGDGVNDAPALATAALGIAMGGAGSAQAMETADLVLMQDDLRRLPLAVRASRQTRRIIWQNIVFSLAVKGLFLALTLPGWATLWLAVFADVGTALLVTFNGLRLLRLKER